jgi:ATP phosphoribosyltransferase
MGNYDLGICGLDWIEELLVKYPSSDIVKVKDLLYGQSSLYMASAKALDLRQNGKPLRIASEYPNLAESFALKSRLSRFSIFPVWGAAEAYPPENADLALLTAGGVGEVSAFGLTPFNRVMESSTYLIANKDSWGKHNLDKIVTSIMGALSETGVTVSEKKDTITAKTTARTQIYDKDTVRLALPDGHQQQQTVEMLNKAGIKIKDYPSAAGNRRPQIGIEGVVVKVIRPQDMPLQVANGNFDLAITGRDWLLDHLAQFPSSPVKEILDLKLRKVRLVAVVSQSLPVDNVADLRGFTTERTVPFRLASEYVNIADKYARENHLGHYRVIPTWGATEAFLPDDADLLIENTETGRTIARHNLKIIETLFESTACLVGNNGAMDVVKRRRIEFITKRLRLAVGET